MSNVLPFPIIARPIPVETDTSDQHTLAMAGIKMCIKFALKTWGPAETERVLTSELSLVKARRVLMSMRDKS